MRRESKTEEEAAILTCTKCKTEHQLEPGQFFDLRRGGLDEKTFCCEMFSRSCISDTSSESDFENFGKSSDEGENCFATEGVDKEFTTFVPSYIGDWIQEAKECDWNESEFVQWLKDFDETSDNVHINLHICEDTWLTTSAIEDTLADAQEAEEESVSIEELLKPCDSDEDEHSLKIFEEDVEQWTFICVDL